MRTHSTFVYLNIPERIHFLPEQYGVMPVKLVQHTEIRKNDVYVNY